MNRPAKSNQVATLKTIAKVFDELFHVPGTNLKFGLDALIGLIPGGGDLVGGAVSAYAILLASRLGAPSSVVLRMGLNILIDTLVGAVPLLGDLFDAGWKANRKNADLLERYVNAPAAAHRSSMAVVIGTIVVVLAVIVGIGAGTVWLISKLF